MLCMLRVVGLSHRSQCNCFITVSSNIIVLICLIERDLGRLYWFQDACTCITMFLVERKSLFDHHLEGKLSSFPWVECKRVCPAFNFLYNNTAFKQFKFTSVICLCLTLTSLNNNYYAS